MKKPAVMISDLSFSYGDGNVLDRVNVQIESNEFIGIVGPNGGGKTTLFKLIMGFLQPKKGSILLGGQVPKEVQQKIGYVPQRLKVDYDFPITVKELVLLGATPKKFAYSSDSKKKADELMELLGLTPFTNATFSDLSGGFAQKALLARALLANPDYLFLDEPMANVDSASSLEIFDLLTTLKKTKTILLITHDLRTVVEKVDRILCVEKQVTSMLPNHVCNHFALGLYHAPLTNPQREEDVFQCIPQ